MAEMRTYKDPADLPCQGQTRATIEAWSAKVGVGDAAVVRESLGDGRFEYSFTHVIELLENGMIVLDRHGTFRVNGPSVFLEEELWMLEPTPQAAEAGRAAAVYSYEDAPARP